MKETVFIKKYIKTEDDLPKEDGYYFVSHGDKYDVNIDVFHFTKINAKQNHIDWLEHVVFYLQEEELPTDEEIETRCNEIANSESKKDFERGEWLGHKEGAKWMREEILKRNK